MEGAMLPDTGYTMAPMPAFQSPEFPELPELTDYQSILASLAGGQPYSDRDALMGETEQGGRDRLYSDYSAPNNQQHTLSAYLQAQQQSTIHGRMFDSTEAEKLAAMPARSAPPTQMAFSAYAQNSANPPNEAFIVNDAQHMRTPQHFAITNSSASSLIPESLWEDQDTIFTPLLSPALTPLSSAMGSSFKSIGDHSAPSSISHIAPSDFFSPLTSPALRPQITSQDSIPPLNPALQHLIEQASLLGIMDGQSQAQAAAAFLQGQRHALQSLGLSHIHSPEQLTNLVHQHLSQQAQQAPQSGESSSGNSISSASGIGPPAFANSSVSKTAPLPQLQPNRPKDAAKSRDNFKGRGASRATAKTRPSPIIRPIPNNSAPLRKVSIGPALVNARSTPSTAANSPAFPPSVFSSVGPIAAHDLSYLESPSPVDLTQSNSAFNPLESTASETSTITIQPPMSAQYSPMTPAGMMNLASDISVFPLGPPCLSEHVQAEPTEIMIEPPETSTKTARGRKPAKKGADGAVKATKARTQRKSAQNSRSAAAIMDAGDDEEPDNRRVSHKHAEQRRRDSLKQCFEELRHLLPHIPPEEDEEAPKRPGEGNVGGQRSGVVDPDNPNKGVSKVALLRKSNEYIGKLNGRIQRRDAVLGILRAKLASLGVVIEDGETDLDLDDLDNVEQGSWPCARSYSDDEDDGEIDIEEATMPPPKILSKSGVRTKR